jgi:hypothetical protein
MQEQLVVPEGYSPEESATGLEQVNPTPAADAVTTEETTETTSEEGSQPQAEPETPTVNAAAQQELDDLRKRILEERKKNVTATLEHKDKPQWKIRKERNRLEKTAKQYPDRPELAEDASKLTDEDYQQERVFHFADNLFGRAIQKATDAVNKVAKELEQQVLDTFVNPRTYGRYYNEKDNTLKQREQQFVEADLDALPETDENSELLALYDEIKSARETLMEEIIDGRPADVLTPYVDQINSLAKQIDDYFEQQEATKQAAEV